MREQGAVVPVWVSRLQWAVPLGLAVAVGLLLLDRVQVGLYVLSATLVAAGVLRWFLPASAVRLLASRRRVTDVIASMSLGLALAAVAVLLPQ